MKLLYDQNLSFRLKDSLTDLFPGSVHIRELGLASAEDQIIWDYAKEKGFLIISKDSDFYQKSTLFGYPPKVIWMRCGNTSTADIETILRKRFEEIENFHLDIESSFLIIE